jgi:hypothetical protein
MYSAKLNNDPKRAKKTFSRGIKSHQKKRFLKLKYFSPLRILTSPLFEESFGAFIFLPFSLFSILFLSLFSMLRLLMTWGF